MKKIFRKFGKTAANYNWYFIFSEKNFDATVLFQMDFEPSPEAARRAEAKRDARDRMINKKIAELFVKTEGKKPAFESLGQIEGVRQDYFDTLWVHLEDEKLLILCLS